MPRKPVRGHPDVLAAIVFSAQEALSAHTVISFASSSCMELCRLSFTSWIS